MNSFKKVRYRHIAKYVYELLNELKIDKYPISIKQIIQKLNIKGYNIEIDTYEQYRAFMNCSMKKKRMPLLSPKEIENKFKSPDGATARFPGTKLLIIFYNSNEPVEGRINWTLAHELGHILLEHYDLMETIILQRHAIEKTKYDWLESEADWFARTLLCHPYVLDYYDINTWDEIMTVCNISYKAAQYRESEIQSKRFIINEPWDYKTLAQLSNFTKACKTCGANLFFQKGNHCPICGNKSIKWGDGELKYTKYLYDTDDNGKLTICPTCKNEDIHTGDYCPICGRNLVNKCDYYEEDCYNSPSGCGKILTPNARFCPDCGLSSNFHRNQWLPEWQVEKDELEEAANNGEQIIIPDMQLEDLKLIQSEWGNIIRELGGAIRPSFQETVVEPSDGNFLCIVFSNPANYAIGSRPTLVGELEEYVQKTYGKKIYFKTRMRNTGEQLNTIYVSDEELKEAVYMDISIDD